MTNILVVAYSYTGTCRRLADLPCDHRSAGPMRTFARLHSGKLADIAVAPVMGGSGAPNAVAELARLTGRAPLLSTAFTAREIEGGSCAGRLRAFGDGVRMAKSAEAPTRPATWSPQTA